MKIQELTIEGMHCDHCVMAVKRELNKLPTVKVDDVQVNKAKVQYDDVVINQEDLSKAVEEAGYKLVG